MIPPAVQHRLASLEITLKLVLMWLEKYQDSGMTAEQCHLLKEALEDCGSEDTDS